MRKTVAKTKFKSNQKGITLIALVITIIVLIILAGVAISMLSGENGILNQAANAKTSTELAKLSESIKLAATTVMTSEEHEFVKEEFEKELEKDGYKVNEDGTITEANEKYAVTEKGALKATVSSLKEEGSIVYFNTILTDEKGEKVTIPEGFKVASDSAISVKDGVVVIAPDGSEFVWIPVKDINSMIMCQSHTGTSNCSIVEDKDGKLVCKNHEGIEICGKLYAAEGGNAFNSGLTTQTYSADDGMREPAVTSHNGHGDYTTVDETRGIGLLKSIVKLKGTNDEIKAQWKNNLQQEFNEMAKYVYKNKGFYVGRFETRIDENGKAKSTRNMKITSLTWYDYYQTEKEYSEKNSLTEAVGSSMIWGCQFDQMMIWMQKNGINVKSTTPTATSSKNLTRITGTAESDKLNNVYDVIGCGMEWTLEAADIYFRHRRGDSWGQNGYTPSQRIVYYIYTSLIDTSSRIALYVK